jgi:hypothetical protein
MLVNGEGSGTLRLFVVGLYSLLISSLIQTVVTLHLYATQSVDTTISAGLILTFVSVRKPAPLTSTASDEGLTSRLKSQISLLFLFIHSWLARRTALGLMRNGSRARLNSVCRCLPRILIMLWITAAAVGLIVAARQPRCTPGHAMQNFWQIGLSCRLHRAIVGMAVVAL